MIRIALVLAIGLVLPQVALAAPLTVQSGEHKGFSRLVVSRPRGTDWKVTHIENQVTLTYTDVNDGFDTTRVFTFIPRDRIEDISSEENTLTFSLSCDCAVSAFELEGPFLVIDVASPGIELSNPLIEKEVAAEEPQPEDPEPRLRAAASALTAPFSAMPLTREPLSSVEQEVLEDVATRLYAEMSLASDRGLLRPAAWPQFAPPMTAAGPEASAVETAVEDATDDVVDTPPTGGRANMRISTSRDFAESNNKPRSGVSQGTQACPTDDRFDLASWGDDSPFSVQIGAARDGLFGEFDRLNPEAAGRLARQYLYFGFGAEARQVLELDPALARDSALLLAMADLMDGHAPAQAEVLTQFTECDSDVALWAVLALPHPFEGAMPNPDAALRALNRLPVHLRDLLAPALSRKLLSNGQPKGASAALRTLERLPTEMSPAGKLAQAHVDLKEGQIERGADRLIEVVEKNAQQSPEALVALVDARISANTPIDVDTANLVEAYAQELRDAPLGPALRRAHVLALLKSGQFDRAFAASKALGGNALTREATALRVQMLHELIHSADDIVFLEHVFTQTDRDIGQMPEADIIALAARFQALGFPLRAEKALAKTSGEPRNEARQLLAAEISLALEKPFKAQADLLGISGETADLLRADAQRMAGAHDQAHTLYAAAGREQDATETAWLSRDWRSLTPQDNPVFGPISAVDAPEPEPVPPSGEGLLARSSAVLEQSAQTREALAILLADAGLAPERENDSLAADGADTELRP